MIELEGRPRHKEGVLAQEADGTRVLFKLRKGEYFSVEGVGERVWNLCDGTRTVSDIVEAISKEYDEERSVIERDVLELLQEFVSEKLIETNG